MNIQCEDEFKCHTLNRDVWSDDCIIDIIGCAFLFWQQQSSINEGKVYIDRYHVVEFPHIGIIDPRTGGLVWSKEGTAEKESISQRLQDFVSDHPNPSTWKPNKLSRGSSVSSVSSEVSIIEAIDCEPPCSVGSSVKAIDSSSSSSLRNETTVTIHDKYNAGFEVIDNTDPPENGEHNHASSEKTKLLFRFPNGSKSEHTFQNKMPIQNLVRFISGILYSTGTRGRFDLMYGYPPASLSEAIRKMLDERASAASGAHSLNNR